MLQSVCIKLLNAMSFNQRYPTVPQNWISPVRLLDNSTKTGSDPGLTSLLDFTIHLHCCKVDLQQTQNISCYQDAANELMTYTKWAKKIDPIR